jgi:hypothetical protein
MDVDLTRRKNKPSRENQVNRYADLVELENTWQSYMQEKSLSAAVRSKKWGLVFHWLETQPSPAKLLTCLKVAIQQKAWKVVLQLVRLGIPQEDHEELLRQMVEEKQWAVCRVLLETHRLPRYVCLRLLPQLVSDGQWLLVCRVLEQGACDDDELERVLKLGMDHREGSVVWHCVTTMPQGKVTPERSRQLLERAWCRQTWQAVMFLLISDLAADVLQSAVDHAQWDLVDHCQAHGADINATDERGDTCLHTAARRRQWKAVRELVSRDAEPNMADSEGLFPLHRACDSGQWSTVDHLVQFQADLNVKDGCERTPMMLIIEGRQGPIIERALFWGQDLLGKTHTGETALHAVCCCDMASTMYYLIRRGVNPLETTLDGESVLLYATRHAVWPEKLVAECISLGFTTHQGPISVSAKALSTIMRVVAQFQTMEDFEFPHALSPFMSALQSSRFTLADALYESGSCSNEELFDTVNEVEAASVGPSFFTMWSRLEYMSILNESGNTQHMNILRDKATTPRRLESLCRLAISHSLDVRGRRERDVLQLRLPELIKNYVLFTDLTSTLLSSQKTADFTRKTEELFADRPDETSMKTKRLREGMDICYRNVFLQRTIANARDIAKSPITFYTGFRYGTNERSNILFPHLSECEVDYS